MEKTMDYIEMVNRSGNKYEGGFQLAGGESIIVDRDGVLRIPRKYDHLIDSKFRSLGFELLSERKERERLDEINARMDAEHRQFPFGATEILTWCRNNDVALKLENNRLFIRGKVTDYTIAKCIQHRKRELIEELRRRESQSWAEVV
jgi:hypothetical protein